MILHPFPQFWYIKRSFVHKFSFRSALCWNNYNTIEFDLHLHANRTLHLHLYYSLAVTIKNNFYFRIFWMLIFFCMILATISGLSALIDVWINYPSIMFIENTKSTIQEIPFPMIMICPSSQMRKSVLEKYSGTNSSYW